MDKRIVHQWEVINGGGCSERPARHWTEIKATVDEILVMLGCHPGSRLIGLQIDRDGSRLTITADENLEAPCPIDGAGGYPTGSPGPSTPSSPPTTTSTPPKGAVAQ